MTRLLVSRPDAPAAKPLLDALAEEYERLYGERVEGELDSRAVEDFVAPRGALLLAIEDGVTVAGGGVTPLAGDTAEIKRMWTAPGHRRRGYARLVLEALEREAARLGYRVLRLQAGARSGPALELYSSCGYVPAPAFGDYRDEPLARGFAKRL
jgi:GNAT superfamily N-acetyltransferase